MTGQTEMEPGRKPMEDIGRKIDSGTVEAADFQEVFEAFAQICNSDDILLFMLKEYSRVFRFIFDEYSFVIEFQKGSCRAYPGSVRLADVTFKIEKGVALDIINGRVYSAVAHMNGDVDYTGYKDDAVRFQGILEQVLDEIIKKKGR